MTVGCALLIVDRVARRPADGAGAANGLAEFATATDGFRGVLDWALRLKVPSAGPQCLGSRRRSRSPGRDLCPAQGE
jgi:hypothetical protein